MIYKKEFFRYAGQSRDHSGFRPMDPARSGFLARACLKLGTFKNVIMKTQTMRHIS
jgi:hypothetical protein